MECPVCFEIFETPLLLPGCGHTICRSCAGMLLTEGNFLRCPECRLVYQLRHGLKSLPKNVALQRTIEEQMRSNSKPNLMCEEHPDDSAALYCKTCEKSICLKCYFTSNTLRKGQSAHSGHQVDTSEDAFTKEMRLLEDKRKDLCGRRQSEREYVRTLEETTKKLKELLNDKVKEIDDNRDTILNQVRQTSGKLKFTLKGSMARDSEYLQMALESSRERLQLMETLIDEADDALLKAVNDLVEVNVVKEIRRKMDKLKEPPDTTRLPSESYLKISSFDTDLQACLDDPRKALSYQTEPPRIPSIEQSQCVISNTVAYIAIQYDETVRVKKMTLYYKEAIFKGFSEKQWNTIHVNDIRKGKASLVVSGLERSTMYRMYVTSNNDFGESDQSKEFWFRTLDAEEIEMRIT